MASMDTLDCTCSGCGNIIGQFVNLWVQIGKTYYSPVVQSHEPPALVPSGVVRQGSSGTLIEGCELQDQACSACRVLVGIKCLEAPVNHALGENQLMLNLHSAISVKKRSRGKVEIVVTRKFKLQTAPAEQNKPERGPGLEHIIPQLQAHGQTIKLIHQAGAKSIERLDTKLETFSADLANLHRTLGSIRADVSSVQDRVASSSVDSKNKEAIDDLRKQITDFQELASDRSAFEGLEAEVQAIKHTHKQLGTQVETASKQAGQIHENIESAVAALRHHLTTSWAAQISSLRAELEQHRAEPNRAQEDEIASLRIEMGRHKKHVEQVQNKELAKVRSELIKQQKAMDLLRKENATAVQGAQAECRDNINEEHGQNISSLQQQITEIHRDVGEQLQSVQTQINRLQQQYTAVKDRSLAQSHSNTVPKQVDLLKARVAEIGARVSQIDNLRMEVDFLQLQVGSSIWQESDDRRFNGSPHPSRTGPRSETAHSQPRLGVEGHTRRHTTTATAFSWHEESDEEHVASSRRKRPLEEGSVYLLTGADSYTQPHHEQEVSCPPSKKRALRGESELSAVRTSARRTRQSTAPAEAISTQRIALYDELPTSPEPAAFPAASPEVQRVQRNTTEQTAHKNARTISKPRLSSRVVSQQRLQSRNR